MGFCVAKTVKFGESVMRLAIDGDLALLHRLEQRGLRLGGRAVDFIGQQKSGENRPFDQREFVALKVENVGAGDIGGHQIGRELDAVELAAEDARESARQQRLGHAGHAFDERVLSQDDDERLADHVLLADNDFAKLGCDAFDSRLKLIEIQNAPRFACRITCIRRRASTGWPLRLCTTVSAAARRSGGISRALLFSHSCQQASTRRLGGT